MDQTIQGTLVVEIIEGCFLVGEIADGIVPSKFLSNMNLLHPEETDE